MILFLEIFNLNLLQVQTTDRMDEALNKQAIDNMGGLIRESGALLFSKIQGIFVMFDFVKEMIKDMYYEQTFALEFLTVLRYDQIPAKSLQTDVEFYGNQSISYNFSCFYNFTESYDGSLLRKVSRLDNIWKMLLDLTNHAVIRYMVYLDDADIFLLYPASKLIKDFDPKLQVWYHTFIEANNQTTVTNAYEDVIGDGRDIISLVAPLTNAQDQQIGMIIADMPVSFIAKAMQNLKYLDSGQTAVVYKNGDILKSTEYPGW